MVTNDNIYEMAMLDGKEQYEVRTPLEKEQVERACGGVMVEPKVLTTANKIVQKIEQKRGVSTELETDLRR